MDLAWLLSFVLTGVSMILLGGWTSYLAYKAKGDRYNLKQESYKHTVGSFKHFWYANRFKMWWFISFTLFLIGAVLIAVGAGINPNDITYDGPNLPTI